jgi:tRNA(Ile)-lysidine synthase
VSKKSSKKSSLARKIFRRFEQEIFRGKLIEPGDHVLLAYSGGQDSSGLLSLLLRLKSKLNFHLSLAHLNHGLRASAREDEEFVRKMAEEHNLPLVIKRVKVREYARRHHLNLEEAGRRLRYEFLEETSRRLLANKIATAHTIDDQAETFLLRLIRGSGPRGLRGILPEIEGRIIRPLIFFRRREIEAYLREINFPYRIDESNLDRRFLRNRIRLELIPLLEKRFSPEIVANLARTADILREEEDFFNQIEEEEEATVIKEEAGTCWLDAEALARLHPALARRLVRRFLVRLRGDLREINFREVEAIRRLESGQRLHLKRQVRLIRLGARIMEEKKLKQGQSYEILWDGSSPLEIPWAGLKFSARKVNRKDLPPYDDWRRALLSLSQLNLPLLVRPRHPGDRYQPLGSEKPRKLKDIMSSRHIPLHLRPFWPVFLSGDQIVWVPGCPVNEAFKIREDEPEILVLEIL